MTKAELLEVIKSLNNEDEILVETADGAVNDFGLEPITMSCEDQTVIGYVLAVRRLEEAH